jgi:hypothetical protein
VFKEELELKQHMAREHADELKMTRAQKREALTIPTQFSVRNAGGLLRAGPCCCWGPVRAGPLPLLGPCCLLGPLPGLPSSHTTPGPPCPSGPA